MAAEIPTQQLSDSIFYSEKDIYGVKRWNHDQQWNPKAATNTVAECIDSVLWEDPLKKPSEIGAILIRRHPELIAKDSYNFQNLKAVMDSVDRAIPNATKDDYWNCILQKRTDLIDHALKIEIRERTILMHLNDKLTALDIAVRRAVMLHYLADKPNVYPDDLPYLDKLGIGKDKVERSKTTSIRFKAE